MPEWQGATLKSTMKGHYAETNRRCFEPFKAANWDAAFDPATFQPCLVNCFELRDSPSVEPNGWTLLHYAASLAAPASVARRLIKAGGLRCVKDSLGRTPLQVAMATSDSGGGDRADLLAELTPKFASLPAGSAIPSDAVLDAIEVNFHKLIREVTMGLADKEHLNLPTVRALLEAPSKEDGLEHWNFPVPGMYGGFYNIRLELALGQEPCLICESWCRVAGGSGRRDKVTAEGTELLESGFV